MKELFLISGLGADRRVFEFLDLSEYKLNYVDWIQPVQDEPIEQYAHRLLMQIPVKKPNLIGVSFGGIMAIEIAKLIGAENIILISSVRTRLELPWYFRLTGKLSLNKILPASSNKPLGFIINYLFGIKTKSEKELLKNIVEETDQAFLRWAIDKIVNWKNKQVLSNTITIHGTNDRIFPKQKANSVIKGGGHFMIVSRAAEVTELIRKSIS